MNSEYPLCAAGIVPARRHRGSWTLLILRARGQWDFPKGGFETGETPLETALREAEEETGIRDFELEFGDTWCDTPPEAGGRITRYYLAVTKTEQLVLPVSADLGYPEHEEWRWIDFNGAAALLRPKLQAVLLWARERLGHGACVV